MNTLTKNEWIAVAVVIVIFLYFLFFTNLFMIGGQPTASTNGPVNNEQLNNEPTTTMPTEPKTLIVQDIVTGTGAEAASGKTVTVNYTGFLTNGTVFDSSIPRGTPFTFALGAGQVIQGWDQGIVGMKVGGKRRLTIPSDLAYGPQAIPDSNGGILIPANSTLIFDVELLDVK